MNYPEFSINTIEHYPEILRRPNRAGKAFDRTDETVAKYRYRFQLLERRAHRMQRADQPLELDEIFHCVTRLSAELSDNAWTQYRSACMQAIRDYFDLDLIDADKTVELVEILDCHTRTRAERDKKTRLPKRTSAGRTKWILQSEQDAIWHILSARNPVDGVLQMINDNGSRVGLRLSEWFNCRVENGNLIVQNAKYSRQNGKGLAPTRTLFLKPNFGEVEIHDLEFGLERLQELVVRFGKKSVKAMLHRRLREVADHVCPNRKITFRTYRDQFRANMVADGHDRYLIAGSMGHSAADSQRKYGETRRGRKGMGLAVCSSELALEVRPGANTVSCQNRRAKIKEGLDKIASWQEEHGENWVEGILNEQPEQHSYDFTPFS